MNKPRGQTNCSERTPTRKTDFYLKTLLFYSRIRDIFIKIKVQHCNLNTLDLSRATKPHLQCLNKDV